MQVLASAATALGERQSAEAMRMIVEAAVSALQALISLLDESTSRHAASDLNAVEVSKQLQSLAMEADCLRLVGRVATRGMLAISTLHVCSLASALWRTPFCLWRTAVADCCSLL